MPFQWSGGQVPKGVTTSKILVLGPDEMFDYDYPMVKKYLDKYTVRLENVAVVVLGDGRKWQLKKSRMSLIGVDYLALKWADEYKWPRILLPEKNYRTPKELDNDLRRTLEEDSYCVWFRDQNAHEWLHERLLKQVLPPERIKVVRI